MAAARRDCRSHYSDGSTAALRELGECLIERWRGELETAKPERVATIQGKIQGLRELFEEAKPSEQQQGEDE